MFPVEDQVHKIWRETITNAKIAGKIYLPVIVLNCRFGLPNNYFLLGVTCLPYIFLFYLAIFIAVSTVLVFLMSINMTESSFIKKNLRDSLVVFMKKEVKVTKTSGFFFPY